MMGEPNVQFAHVESRMAETSLNSAYTFFGSPINKPAQNVQLDLAHGTTLGFKYQGGIVMCTNSRTTIGNFGLRKYQKIVELDKCLLGTIGGCGADCNYWHRELISQCRLYRLENGNKSMPVSSASKIVHNIVMETCLCMGMILAGYDPDGPKFIYVDGSGTHIKGNVFAVGSGKQYALGVFDNAYSWHMSDEAAYNLARHAINTNGLIRIYYMNENGWTFFIENSLKFNMIQARGTTECVPMEIDD